RLSNGALTKNSMRCADVTSSCTPNSMAWRATCFWLRGKAMPRLFQTIPEPPNQTGMSPAWPRPCDSSKGKSAKRRFGCSQCGLHRRHWFLSGAGHQGTSLCTPGAQRRQATQERHEILIFLYFEKFTNRRVQTFAHTANQIRPTPAYL